MVPIALLLVCCGLVQAESPPRWQAPVWPPGPHHMSLGLGIGQDRQVDEVRRAGCVLSISMSQFPAGNSDPSMWLMERVLRKY